MHTGARSSGAIALVFGNSLRMVSPSGPIGMSSMRLRWPSWCVGSIRSGLNSRTYSIVIGIASSPITMEYVRLFKPDLMLPTHHDGHRNRMLDMPMGPLGLAIRDEFPKTRAIAPLLRAPVCINIATRELYVGN